MFTEAQVLQILTNVGIDVKCPGCICTAFTGTNIGSHSCGAPDVIAIVTVDDDEDDPSRIAAREDAELWRAGEEARAEDERQRGVRDEAARDATSLADERRRHEMWNSRDRQE